MHTRSHRIEARILPELPSTKRDLGGSTSAARPLPTQCRSIAHAPDRELALD